MALSEALEEDLVAMVVDSVASEDILVVHQPGVPSKGLIFSSDEGRFVVVMVVVFVMFVVFVVAQRGAFISLSREYRRGCSRASSVSRLLCHRPEGP